jgi:hypothetical protein
MQRVIGIAALLLSTMTVCVAAPAAKGAFMGPMNVERFIALKERLGVDPKAPLVSYISNATYNDFMNVLVESILVFQSVHFCLRESYTNKPAGILFYEAVQMVDALVDKAGPDELLRDAIVDRLVTDYPCPKK